MAAAPSLREAFTTPDNKQAYVRRLFSLIAHRYDLITVLLSCGRDRTWKRRLVSMSSADAGCVALDVACGTGDISFELALRGAWTIGLDVTLPMLTIARSRAPGPSPRFVGGDMMALPFPGSRFDVVTTGYGVRNVPDIDVALGEIHRVLRPGGVFLSLDFNRPANPLVRAVYLSYLTVVGSALGFVLHREPDAYRYIPESIRRYPGAPAVSEMLRSAGFRESEWHPVLGGLMAIHRAVK